MPLRPPSTFQMCLLTVLTVCAILWLLLLTSFREYWGFWQSPEEYSFLRREYPLWLRDYVRDYFTPTLWGTVTLYLFWLFYAARGLRRVVQGPSFYGKLGVVLAVTFLMAGAMGMRLANNIISWIDSGQLHGNTFMRVRD